MKFGADLKNSIVPEWEHGYISYDELKRLIKELTSLEGSAKESAQEDFFMMLEDELEKVNRFYLEKIGEFDVELRKLESRPRAGSRQARQVFEARQAQVAAQAQAAAAGVRLFFFYTYADSPNSACTEGF